MLLLIEGKIKIYHTDEDTVDTRPLKGMQYKISLAEVAQKDRDMRELPMDFLRTMTTNKLNEMML